MVNIVICHSQIIFIFFEKFTGLLSISYFTTILSSEDKFTIFKIAIISYIIKLYIKINLKQLIPIYLETICEIA